MSVLVIAGDPRIDVPLAHRLVDQGDVVGVLVEDDSAVELFEEVGAHVARGSAADDDLVERAATHARTIVLFEDARVRSHRDVVGAAITAGERIGGVRIVLWGPRHSTESVDALQASGLSYVIIRSGRPRAWSRKEIPPDRLIEAIDAADDLSGEVRLEVDLREQGAWGRLGLEPPG